MALAHQGVQQLAAAIVCMSLSAIAVSIRFWCKFILKNGLHWDDFWILASLISYAGGLSGEIWGKYPRVVIMFDKRGFSLTKHHVQVFSLVRGA